MVARAPESTALPSVLCGGRSVSVNFECDFCGGSLDELDDYCSDCGAKLGWDCITIEEDFPANVGIVPAVEV